MNYYYDWIKFHYNRQTHEISSIDVFMGEEEDTVLITQSYIRNLAEANLLCECSHEIFFIVAKAIQFKKENLKRVQNCVPPYDLGNTETFSEKRVCSLV